jgi:hypothetical protein
MVLDDPALVTLPQFLFHQKYQQKSARCAENETNQQITARGWPVIETPTGAEFCKTNVKVFHPLFFLLGLEPRDLFTPSFAISR